MGMELDIFLSGLRLCLVLMLPLLALSVIAGIINALLRVLFRYQERAFSYAVVSLVFGIGLYLLFGIYSKNILEFTTEVWTNPKRY